MPLHLLVYSFVFLQVVGYLTVTSRLPTKPSTTFELKSFLRPFKSRTFQLLGLSMCLYLGLYLPLTYIAVQAQEEGISDSLAGKMVVIINASSCKSSGAGHVTPQCLL